MLNEEFMAILSYLTHFFVKCTNILDGDEDIIFEEDEEEDEGYLFAGQGNPVAIFKTRIRLSYF
jgi:hypothetical protein